MDRSEFGKLVASLRNDLSWTQKDLAKKTGLDISVISNIERGEKKMILKDNLHVKLADGFRLTSLERMEFMLAASNVTEVVNIRRKKNQSKDQFDPKAFLKWTGENMAGIALPVFVTDAFCDIVLANYCVMEFYGLPLEILQTADSMIGGYNTLRYIFDPRFHFLDTHRGEEWERLALINTRYFRRQTLRVRSKPYFSELLNELLDPGKYPSFDRCWQKILFDELDDYSLSITKSDDKDSAHSFVSVETLFALTPYGELYMHQVLPLNRKTAERIAKISKKVGEGYGQFAAFPDKRKL